MRMVENIKIFVAFDAMKQCNIFALDIYCISKKDALNKYEIIVAWNFTISSITVLDIY